MPAPTLSYAELKALSPCADAMRRVTKLMGGARKWSTGVTAAQARDAGATMDDIIWAASELAHTHPGVERRMRLWLADCAARVLQIYEQDYPADDRPRNAIITARQFAQGEVSSAAWAAAKDAAWTAARDAAWTAAKDAAWAAARDAAGDAAWAAARDAARDAARAAAWTAARDAARDAAGAAARTAARDAAGDAAKDAEEGWQFDRLIAWLSDEEPADWPLPVKTQQEAA